MTSLVRTSPAADLVARILSVPPEPAPPAGAHESIETFRGAPGFYKYQLIKWAITQVSAGIGLYFGFWFLQMLPEFPFKWVLEVLEILGVLTYLASLVFTYFMVHLDYQMRWYIVTDRSLRIREGLVNISEKTMSFANIQNISVRQGPLQRLLGIADVEVRTAGGGGSASSKQVEQHGGDTHLGYFRGVDNAQEIRDRILARVRVLRDTGIGDPDSPAAHHAPPPAGAVEAARRLLDEARALRKAVLASPSGGAGRESHP